MEYDRTHCFGYPSCRVMSRSHPVTGRTAFPQLSCKTLLPDTHGHPSPHRTHIARCACDSQGAQHHASSAHSGSNRLRRFYPVNIATTACSASANNLPTTNVYRKKIDTCYFWYWTPCKTVRPVPAEHVLLPYGHVNDGYVTVDG